MQSPLCLTRELPAVFPGARHISKTASLPHIFLPNKDKSFVLLFCKKIKKYIIGISDAARRFAENPIYISRIWCQPWYFFSLKRPFSFMRAPNMVGIRIPREMNSNPGLLQSESMLLLYRVNFVLCIAANTADKCLKVIL